MIVDDSESSMTAVVLCRFHHRLRYPSMFDMPFTSAIGFVIEFGVGVLTLLCVEVLIVRLKSFVFP